MRHKYLHKSRCDRTEERKMSREILFKAKRKDNGKWVEGYYLNIAKINHFICTGKIKLDGALKGSYSS